MDLARDNYLKIGPYLDLLRGIHTVLGVNEGIIKLVGPEGAGKTSLCLQLISELEAEKQEVIFFDTPPESSDFLFQHIQSCLGLDKKKDFNRALSKYLLEDSESGRLIIIYNDAERIPADLFLLIRLLNNVHDDSKTLVSQIITGTKELDTLFDNPSLRSLTQYLNQSFTIAPMTRDELDDFYSAYKKQADFAGDRGKDLGNKELTDLFIQSKGYPGETLELLDKHYSIAENSAQGKEADLIDKEVDVEEVNVEKPDIEELAIKEQGPAQEMVEEIKDTDQEQVESAAEQEAIASEASAEITELDTTPQVNEKELNEILGEEPEEQNELGPVYFKIALSAIVVISTLVLGVVISRNSNEVADPIASIIEDDSPMYLDELPEQAVEPIVTTDISSPPLLTESLEEEALDVEVISEDPSQVQPPEIAGESLEIVSESMTGDIPEEQPGEIIEDLVTEQVEEPSALAPVVVSDAGSNDEEVLASEAASEIPPLAVSDMDSEPVSIPSPLESESLITGTSEIEIVEPEAVEPESVRISETTNAVSMQNVLEDQISLWLAAWKDGNAEAYLGSYHEDFMPSYHDSFEEWESERRSRVEGVTGITTSFDRFEITAAEENSFTVRFWLQYARGNYADETLKELRFINQADNWLIVAERNIQINRL